MRRPGALFPVGRLAGPEDVVDRQEFIEDTVRELLSGQSILVTGPRRIGKSSVALEILRRLKAQGCHGGRIDLFYVASVEEFASLLWQLVLEQRFGPSRAVIRTLKGIQERIRHIVLTQSIGDFDVEIQFPLHGEAPRPDEALALALEYADRWAARQGAPFVVLLDEFQELERLGGTPLIKKLRSIFQAQERCTYLLLGSQESTLKTLFSDRRQAFYRFASIKALPPVPGEAWLEYLRGKYESVGIKTSTVALEIMIRETGGHPFGMMQLANAVYLRCLPRQKPAVSAELVLATLEEDVLARLTPIYEKEWEDVRKVKQAPEVVQALLAERPPYGLGIPSGRVTEILSRLQEQGVIARMDRGRYAFVEALFAKWLKRQLGME
ncbi:MAG: hypothetical protein CW345_05420 [Firmicutes bacterium]|nr:hypothetical protein [Bacillota bacterium]MBO2521228.1 hypothetical protein [Bacillota bacterium]